MRKVIKFTHYISSQSALECVSVIDGAHVQWQIVPRLGGRRAEGALSKLQACPWNLKILPRG